MKREIVKRMVIAGVIALTLGTGAAVTFPKTTMTAVQAARQNAEQSGATDVKEGQSFTIVPEGLSQYEYTRYWFSFSLDQDAVVQINTKKEGYADKTDTYAPTAKISTSFDMNVYRTDGTTEKTYTIQQDENTAEISLKRGKYYLRFSFLRTLCPEKVTVKVAVKGDSRENSPVAEAVSPAWKSDTNGWWYSDADGSFPKNSWKQINGSWYYFNASGYMETGCYVDGCWISADGTWNPASAAGSWQTDGSGWWYSDAAGWYPVSQWLKINGSWYYFNASGYMETGCYVDGCWIDADGTWNPASAAGSWQADGSGWWYSDAAGWYPVNQWLKINGSWYWFDASGYMVINRYVDGCWIGADGVMQ